MVPFHKTLKAALVVGLLLAEPARSQRPTVPKPNTSHAGTPVRSAATVSTRTAPSHPKIRGYVLTHEHPTQGMAFGGNYAFAGAEGNYKNGIMDKGYTAACAGCKVLSGCDHGEVKGNFVAATKTMGPDMGDHKGHKGPKYNAFSHLRYSTEWIREAFNPTEPEYQDTRMRIFVAFAVETESMCEQLYYANTGKGGPGGDGYPCPKGDSLESLERQLDALKAWASENSSWMEIAYSAADARRIAKANKLVVILGIESEYAFGAEDRTFDPVTRLRRYYDKGVRTFYLAHKINSRLAGADIFLDRRSFGGKAIRASQAISGCLYYDDNVGPFPLVSAKGHNYCANNCGNSFFKGPLLTDRCVGKMSDMSEANMAAYLLRAGDTFNGFKVYPLPPGFHSYDGKGGSRIVKAEDSGYTKDVERNNLGLSHDGERVVREAMLKGMIVNIDHVSSVARKNIYDIAKSDFGGYPLNALHNNPNKMLTGDSVPHEYEFDENEIDFVLETGGFWGVRVGPLDAKEHPASGVDSGVTANCPKTITETAKILAYLLAKGLKVGYSGDFATITQGVHSRTMRNCGLDLGTDHLHMYGSQTADGLSHVGMFKKWHRELEAIKLKKEFLDQLRNDGVEAFLAMWERASAKSKLGKQIPRQEFPRQSAAPLKAHGEPCTRASQCASSRCSWGFCADADECRSNGDCATGQYCGDPISGKAKCKDLLPSGKACTKRSQCRSGRCSFFRCK